MEDTLEKVKKRVAELQPLYDRMDKTKDLVYLSPYKMRNFDKAEMENVINVTTNWPAIYANAIISDLMGAIWQTVIESNTKLSDKQKHVIENFIEDNLAQADEQLATRGMADLFTWLCNHVCIRSLIGARWISQFDKGVYKNDCLPVDMRWTPFEFGKDGLSWVAHKTFRSKARILSQYGVDVGEDEIEVTDFWDCEKNEVWLGDEKVDTVVVNGKVQKRQEEHPFGYPPFVIVIPSSGFMLRDKGYIEHEGEDLLFLSRGLYEERSRQVSIEQTLGMDVLFPPYEQESDEPGTPADKPPKTMQTKKVKKGELHQLLPRGDITNAFRASRADIQNMIEMGGPLLPRAYNQPPSAVEVQAEVELLARWHYPRVKALAQFRQQLSRMMIDQYIKISEQVKGKSDITIGATGQKRIYSVQQLGDPGTYTIKNQLMTKSKKQEIVNLAMFEAARGELPLRVRLTDILMADDPDGIMRELDIEKARQADPAIGLFEMAIRYAEEAENLEGSDADTRKIQSMMLTERGCSIIRQRAQMPQPLPEEATVPREKTKGPSGQPLMHLMGGGGGGGGQRQPTEEATIGD